VRVGYPTSRRPAVAAQVVAIVRGAAARFGDRVRFEFVGWMPDELEGAPNASLTPTIAEYDRYLAHVRSRGWDLGLAPLAGTGFETFKTDIKYREYAALGVAGVYARCSPYLDSVADGRTGVLADAGAAAWLEAIDRLVASPATREAIARAARDEVARHRDLRVTGSRHAELLPAPAAA
jgi:glycosyltransferase involved in cell wall biosynthesis